MSTARLEKIIKKGFINSLLDGTLEIKDLSGISDNLELARMAYLQGLTETSLQNQGKIYVLTPSDAVQIEDLDPESNWGTEYVKKKQFTILTSGIIRVTAQIKAQEGFTCYAQLRINDIEVETWETTEYGDYVPKTADIAIGVGDLQQLWIKSSGDSASNLKDARIKCDLKLSAPSVGLVST